MNKHFCESCAVALLLLMCSLGYAESVADMHAGFSVELNDPQRWVSQLTHSPGVTSKLCLSRQAPQVLICLQSLYQPIDATGVPDLARGFVDAFAERFGVAVPPQLSSQRFQELAGYSHRFELSQAKAPAGLSDVWLFAGTGPAGQPQMIIAFWAPEERERASAEVTATVNAVRYDADKF